MIGIEPFRVGTNEQIAEGKGLRALIPGDTDSPDLFLLQDPFGLRKAIAPVFQLSSDGSLKGLGTAFSINPWGDFLTATHVAEVVHGRKVLGAGNDKFDPNVNLILLLGMGLVFGTVGVPTDALANVKSTWHPIIPDQDPIAALQGRPSHKNLDLCLMKIEARSPNLLHSLPIMAEPKGPRIGELVVAIGYPQIDTFSGTMDRAVTTITEGMKVAYGIVTDHYPGGRDSANRTPVFEVEANWPPGMSGGPVFNEKGEVIGLVSRSIMANTPGQLGTAWATWLEAFNGMPDWAPTLDPLNPSHRRCWCIVSENSGDCIAAFPDENSAIAAIDASDSDLKVKFGIWRIGSRDFLSDASLPR